MKNFLFVLLVLGLVIGVQSMTVAEEVVVPQAGIEEVVEAPETVEAVEAVVEDGMMVADEAAMDAEAAEDMMAAVEDAMEMYEGTVSSVDAATGKIVINYVADAEALEATDADFWVNEATMIANGDQAGTLADIKTGDKVAFAYTTNEEGGKVLAHLHLLAE